MGELKRNRNRLGLSTTELAHRLGVSQSTALRLEQSEDSDGITLASLKRVAKALGLELTYKLTSPSRGSLRRSRSQKKGMTRVRSNLRSASETAHRLSDDISRRARALTPIERLNEACELSDLAQELRRV